MSPEHREQLTRRCYEFAADDAKVDVKVVAF
jgi:hypothetical protein